MNFDIDSSESSPGKMSRRAAARLLAQGAAGLILTRTALATEETQTAGKLPLLQRAIPSSGEKLPVIGLGTWQAFDVSPDPAERQPLEEVLALFVKLGGRVVDSSPMYGRAEQVIGDIAQKLDLHRSLFLATKVWTTGKEAGLASMEKSLAKLQTKNIDLMQVHNLIDAKTHLATLRDWKEQGRARYLGITHYSSSAYSESDQAAAERKARLPADQLLAPRARGGKRNPATRAGTGGCRSRESPLRRREPLFARARKAVTGMGA